MAGWLTVVLWVVAVAWLLWVMRKSGPKEGQTYLSWLALTVFVAAVGMAASRLFDRETRDCALPWICLGCALAIVIGCVVGFVRSRREARARAERAAQRRARRETGTAR